MVSTAFPRQCGILLGLAFLLGGMNVSGEMKEQWERIEGRVDPERYKVVHDKLLRQAEDAKVWREQSLAYFRRFSGRPVP